MANGNRGSGDTIDRERVERVEATQVYVDRSAVRYLRGEEVELDKAAVQRLRAGTADIANSAVGSARFERGTVRQSAAGIVSGRSVACDEVRAGVLIAPVVRGDVHTWLDMRSAVAIGFGVALGRLVIAAVRGLGRRALG